MGSVTDDQEKDRRGAALIGELLMQLGRRDSFRKKLAELEERIGPSAVSKLLDEIERTMDRLGEDVVKNTPVMTAEKTVAQVSSVPAPPVSQSKEPPKKQVPIEELPPPPKDPFADLLANLDLSTVEAPPVKSKLEEPSFETKAKVTQTAKSKEATLPEAKQEEAKKGPFVSTPVPVSESPTKRSSVPPREQRDMASTPAPVPPPVVRPPKAEEDKSRAAKTEVENLGKKPPATAPVREVRETAAGEIKAPQPKLSQPGPDKTSKEIVVGVGERKGDVTPQAQPSPKPEKSTDPSLAMPKHVDTGTTYPLDDDDIVYFHAVAQIPLGEKPSTTPFLLEDRGIEAKESVFGLDRGGLRFYLSRITGRSMNVNKAGMLLLNKQESLHLRGTHFGILNNLRGYGVLLPFEFGSVAVSLNDLYSKIDGHAYELRDALEEVMATKWWEVTVQALDAKMAPIVAPEGVSTSGRERGRRGGSDRAQGIGSRIDIKTLERILNKQKAIAVEIHEQLEALAVRSDVDMMVSLSSGSSDDWKTILRASYEVSFPEIYRFNHVLVDLQYHHIKFQLMFVLKGDHEDYTFLGK